MREAVRQKYLRTKQGRIVGGNRVEFDGYIDDEGFLKPLTDEPLVFSPITRQEGNRCEVVVHPAISGNPTVLLFESGEEIKYLISEDDVDLEGLPYVFRVYVRK